MAKACQLGCECCAGKYGDSHDGECCEGAHCQAPKADRYGYEEFLARDLRLANEHKKAQAVAEMDDKIRANARQPKVETVRAAPSSPHRETEEEYG